MPVETMQQIKTSEDVRRLGTILGVWAHPDDESYLAAGVMATAAKNGQRVVCVTATKGEAGSQDEKRWPPATLGETRTRELQMALKELGIAEHHWLGYPDGGCADVPEAEVVERLVKLIGEVEPDTILTFGPDGLTGHPDHATVSRWSELAAEGSGRAVQIYHAVHTPKQYDEFLKDFDEQLDVFFNIDQPPLVPESECAIAYALPGEVVRQKHKALSAMPSQTEALYNIFPPAWLDLAFAVEYFVMSESGMRSRPESYWKQRLTSEQYAVMRQNGTEAPWTGIYADHHQKGLYCCAGCGQELFSSEAKFESGSGWPSFFDVAAKGNVQLEEDSSFGMTRVAVSCSRCGSHLGHVFPDGPADKGGQRYCINSCALDFKDNK